MGDPTDDDQLIFILILEYKSILWTYFNKFAVELGFKGFLVVYLHVLVELKRRAVLSKLNGGKFYPNVVLSGQ